MTREALREGWIRAQKQTYRWPRILKRVIVEAPRRTPVITAVTLLINFGYWSSIREIGDGGDVLPELEGEGPEETRVSLDVS